MGVGYTYAVVDYRLGGPGSEFGVFPQRAEGGQGNDTNRSI